MTNDIERRRARSKRYGEEIDASKLDTLAWYAGQVAALREEMRPR